MGQIRDDVFRAHLAKYPSERERLLPFLHNFDVTWGSKVREKGTAVSVYFLLPERAIQEQFGIESEILLAMSDYPDVQARTLLLIDNVIQNAGRGRVDQTTFFLVGTNDNGREWVLEHAAMNSQTRVPIVITSKELTVARTDPWAIRTHMTNQLYSRDLFNEQLPLRSDLFFFGRDQIVAEFLTAIKQSQNRGLFGLRKTGKTSLLFKVRRMAHQEGLHVLYYDCKDPAIRNLTWIQLVERMVEDIARAAGRTPKDRLSSAHPSDRFKQVVAAATGNTKLAIIFDEIEYVSPIAQLDVHWQSEFIPFWQTMWTTQSNTRKLAFVIAGVNPTIVEMDVVQGVQNPVFGIVTPKYLTGLSDTETRSMLHQFGKRMGLKFEFDASHYMFDRYGGHPLLTRMAGSFVNHSLAANGAPRPVKITKQMLVENETAREQEMSFYCRHITSELRHFYPLEYEMLEMLAAGSIGDFMELSAEHEHTRHLKNYGLVDLEPGRVPSIKIPVMKRYINEERLKRDRGAAELHVVPQEHRPGWVRTRVQRVTADIRRLDRLGEKMGKAPLYGPNGFPEAERFSAVEPVISHETFQSFINVANRCFVEPVEQLGKASKRTNYFWNDIKSDYPDLWDALLRIKLYRHDQMHLKLNPTVDAELDKLMTRDLQGKKLLSFKEPWFLLQQLVLDGLFVGTQVELDKLA